MWKAPLQVVTLLQSMTLHWGLPLDMDQGPQQQSTHHGLPLLATTEPLPPLYLQVSIGGVLELNHIIGST